MPTHDLAFALRSLRRSPGFAVTAILVLGLGIGGVSAFFSAAEMALFKSVPVSAPDRLVWVSARWRDGARFQGLSYPDFADYRARNTTLSSLAAFYPTPFSLAPEKGEPTRVNGQLVSGNYFDTLGVSPAPGRGFLPAEDEVPGRDPVVVLSHALWKRLYGGDPSIVGRRIQVNGTAFTVAGVAPRGFTGVELEHPADLWVPLAVTAVAVPRTPNLLSSRESAFLSSFGRLKDGVDLAAASANFRSLADGLAREFPRVRPGFGVSVSPVQGWLPPGARRAAIPFGAMLFTLALLVLLIAGANVAGLLLVRGAARGRELGVRAALGATRGRIVRLLLAESVVVSVAGAALGALLATAGVSALGAFIETSPAFAEAIRPDARVLVATMLVGLLTGIGAGILPALESVRDAAPASSLAAASRHRLQRVLVTVQMALSALLLVAAGLLLRTLGRTAEVDPGFQPSRVATASFDLALQGYGREAADAFLATLSERLRAHPEVESTAVAGLLPLGGVMMGKAFAPESAKGEPVDWPIVFFDAVSPGYFATLGAHLVEGREIGIADGPGAPRVAVVNRTMARQLWPDQSALGKRLRERSGTDLLTVVGVVADLKVDDVTDEPAPYLYLSRAQVPGPPAESHLLVRARGDAAPVATILRHEIEALDRRLPLFGKATLRDVLYEREDRRRALTGLVTAFGAGALALAALGLYGVVAFGVARRTREIGVRMALGARPREVAAQFVTEGLRLALRGAGAGLVAAVAAAFLMRQLLFGISPVDLPTFAGVGLVLALVAGAASLVPALRAANVDPARALRAD